jgi:hypothetical protein
MNDLDGIAGTADCARLPGRAVGRAIVHIRHRGMMSVGGHSRKLAQGTIVAAGLGAFYESILNA